MSATTLLVIIAIIGMLIYVGAGNSKVAELGRMLFFCALFALCMSAAHVARLI